MRIAISGTQSTGKTTLAGDLAGVLPNTRVEPEPFRVLQNRLGLVSGADSMTPEQELALIRHAGSRLSALRAGETVVFDRCALDALAHAVVAAESGNPAFTEAWLARLRSEAIPALNPLDLLVIVPLEDDLALIDDGVRSTDGAYQAAVDRTIRSLAGDLPNVLEVRGSRTERVRRILLEIDPNGDYATS
jgi:nicotinamide riboside kinase